MEKTDELVKNYQLENSLLLEMVRKLTYQLYGRKSEKYVLEDDWNQKCLFEDSDHFAQDEPDGDDSGDTITVPEHERKKKGRKPIPAGLPRVEVIHDLSEEEKRCGCGCQMSRIGEESSEKLEMLPAQLWVSRHIRYKYACKHCEGVESSQGGVKLAAGAVQILPKSIATPSLLAHLFVSKFADALPFYRQEKQFLRYGIELPRATMCRWAFKISDKLTPLLEMLREQLLCGPLIGIDETPIQVLNEPGRSVGSKSYMWVLRGGLSPPGEAEGKSKGIVIFHYSTSRSGKVAAQFLGDYQGQVQTDGWGGYDFLDTREGIIHLGCWAHARRKFVDVARLHTGSGKKQGQIGMCGHAIQRIRHLYRIERKAVREKLSAQELYQLRQDQARPILDKFGDWLKENAVTVPPKSTLGEAFKYAINQWPRLINYLRSGRAHIDNNLTENAIRPFVVGRKNWLFSDQPEGAKASALFYSFIETAKANGLEPYSYFLYLFDRLPYASTDDDYKKLLPTALTAERLTEFKKEYWFRYDDALKK
ncbi:MAG: IS66 family transposase [bacterium]|nr:IS66 family transposase [bacterium]